jgi:hypothetical protein
LFIIPWKPGITVGRYREIEAGGTVGIILSTPTNRYRVRVSISLLPAPGLWPGLGSVRGMGLGICVADGIKISSPVSIVLMFTGAERKNSGVIHD